jgi:hypothetical protein
MVERLSVTTRDNHPLVRMERLGAWLEVGVPQVGTIAQEGHTVTAAGKGARLRVIPLKRTYATDGRVILPQHHDGGVDIELTLDSAPKGGTVSLPITYSPNLRFYYQRALTAEEVAAGAYCPDNVVGSYAVYLEGQPVYSDAARAEKYRAGKVFHIYRPRIIDAAGNWTWGTLNIANGLLTVTIDEKWLAEAQYPIHTGTANFGYETSGASSQSTVDRITGSLFTGAAGTLVSVSGYLSVADKYTRSLKHAIYESDGDLVDYTESVALSSLAASWCTLNVVGGASITAQGYVLVSWRDSGFGGAMLYYDDGDGTEQGHYQTATYSTWPDPATWTHEDRKYSIYCTYEEASTAITGASALTALPATLAASAVERLSGTGALTAPQATLVSTAKERLLATGALTALPPTLAATGTAYSLKLTAEQVGGSIVLSWT